MTDRTPQSQDKFIVRLPDGLRDRIKNAAAENGRSMNAEVVGTLLDAYPDYSEVSKKLAKATHVAMKILETKGVDLDSEEFFQIIGEVTTKFLRDVELPVAQFKTVDYD